MNLAAKDGSTETAAQWSLAPGVTYLNHGSFGPAPRPVLQARRNWFEQLQSNPVDFFTRRLEGLLAEVRQRLGSFLACAADDLLLVDNATWAMNTVAQSVALAAGDEVLLTDHEYGAVVRLWERRCSQAGARLIIQPLPQPLVSADEVVATLLAAATPRTRLLVFSHITSPTAVILPAAAICRAARRRGIPICIDGPHALLQTEVDLRAIDCDYYCASCHKWLSAPFGAGFLYVNPRVRKTIEPLVVSWGSQRFPGAEPNLQNEFTWLGTRDPSAWLAIPAAIDFCQRAGVERFRQHSHALAQQAWRLLAPLMQRVPLVPDDPAWYGSMISLPLPEGDAPSLQGKLWEHYRIEIPIVAWQGRRLVRPSCHWYTQPEQLELLSEALGQLLDEERCAGGRPGG